MIDYAIVVIMGSTSKFIQACQILELVDLNYDAMDSQKKFINSMIDKMNSERAYDALIGDVLEKIIFSYKFHHPTIREVLEYFVDSVIVNGKKYLTVDKFIEITK